MIDIPKDNLKRLAFETHSGVTFYLKGAIVDQVKRTFFSLPETSIKEEPVSMSDFLGTPIMSNITFGNPGPDPKNPITNYYIDLNGNQIPYEPLTLDLVLLTVSNDKNIIKTVIQGRNGTVKEYISDGDYQIELKGIISNKDNVYPKETIQKLINILKIPSEIPVISDYLQLFGINYVVIVPSNFPQIEGFRNQQEFTITMLSDEPINLENISENQAGQPILIDSNINLNSVNTIA